MIKANEQWLLWDYVGLRRSKAIDAKGGVGPFRLSQDDLLVPRHMNCINYESCLTFSSKHRWQSFSCMGCRKTNHGKFVDSNKRMAYSDEHQ